MNRMLAILLIVVSAPLWAHSQEASPILDRSELRRTGDLDEMRQRRVIRVLVTHNKTNFFVTSGRWLSCPSTSPSCCPFWSKAREISQPQP